MPVISVASDEEQRVSMRNLEITYQALNVVDAAQTIYFLHTDKAHELNPLLTSHPSVLQILAFKAAMGVGHYALMEAVYDYNPKLARGLEYFTIAIQGTVVGLNLRYSF